MNTPQVIDPRQLTPGQLKALLCLAVFKHRRVNNGYYSSGTGNTIYLRTVRRLQALGLVKAPIGMIEVTWLGRQTIGIAEERKRAWSEKRLKRELPDEIKTD